MSDEKALSHCCLHCFFSNAEVGSTTSIVKCQRYPVVQVVNSTYWCGEFKFNPEILDPSHIHPRIRTKAGD